MFDVYMCSYAYVCMYTSIVNKLKAFKEFLSGLVRNNRRRTTSLFERSMGLQTKVYGQNKKKTLTSVVLIL